MNFHLFVLLLFFGFCHTEETKTFLCADESCSLPIYSGKLISNYVDVETQKQISKDTFVDVMGKMHSNENTLLVLHEASTFFIDSSLIEHKLVKHKHDFSLVSVPIPISLQNAIPSAVKNPLENKLEFSQQQQIEQQFHNEKEEWENELKKQVKDEDERNKLIKSRYETMTEETLKESETSTESLLVNGATVSQQDVKKYKNELEKQSEYHMAKDKNEEDKIQKEYYQKEDDSNLEKLAGQTKLQEEELKEKREKLDRDQKLKEENILTQQREEIIKKQNDEEEKIEKQKVNDKILTEKDAERLRKLKEDLEKSHKLIKENEDDAHFEKIDEQKQQEKKVEEENIEKQKVIDKLLKEQVSERSRKLYEDEEKSHKFMKENEDDTHFTKINKEEQQKEEMLQKKKVEEENIEKQKVNDKILKEQDAERLRKLKEDEEKIHKLMKENEDDTHGKFAEQEYVKERQKQKYKEQIEIEISEKTKIEKQKEHDQILIHQDENRIKINKDLDLSVMQQEEKIKHDTLTKQKIAEHLNPQKYTQEKHFQQPQEIAKLKKSKESVISRDNDFIELNEETMVIENDSKFIQKLPNIDIDASEGFDTTSVPFFNSNDPDLMSNLKSDNDNVNDVDKSINLGFFRCLMISANFSKTSLKRLPPSSGKRSTLAHLFTIFIQNIFMLADKLLSYFPIRFVQIIDGILIYACDFNLNYMVAWILFLLSTGFTFILIKYTAQVCFGGNRDSAATRSLEDWTAIEENANQLVDRLADQEEINARLTVWATHLSEQCENQSRMSHSTEEVTTNRLRTAQSCLNQSLREVKELKDTHDALVNQLAKFKQESSLTQSRQEEQIATLLHQLQRTLEEKQNILEESDNLRESLAKEAIEERNVLVKQSEGYAARIAEMETAVDELTGSNRILEEELVSRDRELASLRDAFIQIKSVSLAHFEKKKIATKTPTPFTALEDSDGWEVEEVNLEDNQASESPEDEESIETALKSFLDLGKLRASLSAAEEQLRSETCRRKQETELRSQLQEKLVLTEESNSNLSQKFSRAEEERHAAENKLEILSEYFKEREAVLQRDLGRQALTESEAGDELNFLRQRAKVLDAEVQTLRLQITSARREQVEAERVSRRQVTELDKRLHDNWLAARSSDNLVKELRAENTSLRQKMGEGEKAVLAQLISRGLPLPVPPPLLSKTNTKGLVKAIMSPEVRPLSRKSGVIPSQHFPPPPSGMPFPIAPDGYFIPPPPPPPPGMGPLPFPPHLSNRSSPMMPGWELNGKNAHSNSGGSSSRSGKRS